MCTCAAIPIANRSGSTAARVATADGWEWWEAPLVVENLSYGYRFLIVLTDRSTHWVNAAGISAIETLDSEDFKLLAYPAPPAWGRSSVMYQIFPDRFARSAAADQREVPAWAKPAKWTDEPIHAGKDTPLQYYGGDLAGIQEHLDHLERLGVNLIYLTPFFPARSNHRYNATSFDVVDPLLGGDEALVELVSRGARSRLQGDRRSDVQPLRRHARVVRSGAPQPGAPESAYYYFQDERNETYASWLGEPTLPKFNWASEELLSRFVSDEMSVVAKWLRPPYSLDGWRIDVANMTGRHLGEDLNATVRRTIRERMLSINPDTLLVGESTNDATHDFQGDAWHGAMTYANFTRPIWAWLSREGPAEWFFGLPYGGIPRYTGARGGRGVRPVHLGLAVAGAAAHDERAGHPRHRPVREPCGARHAAGRGGDADDAAGPPAGVGRGRVRARGGGRRALAHADPVGRRGCGGADDRPLRRAHPDAAGAPSADRGRPAMAACVGGRDRVRAGASRWDRCWSRPRGRATMSSSTSTPCRQGRALFGDGELRGRTLRGIGPSFTAWSLPGVKLPQFSTG